MKWASIEQSLSDLSRRDDLALRVNELISSDPYVEKIDQFGSIAEGRSDKYSDVDLVVHVRGISDRTFVELVPDRLRSIGPTLIEGWSLAALPDTHARTLYFKDYPLFWHIDIGCVSDIHIDGTDLMQTYHWPQRFKMWIELVAEMQRGNDILSAIDEFFIKYGHVYQESDGVAERLSLCLDLTYKRALKRGAPCTELFERCNELRHEYLSKK